MKTQSLVRVQRSVQDTHFFIYKEKKYPIKFDLFKDASEYFYSNKKELKKSKIIPLIDESECMDFTIPETSIHQFIDYVHCQSIPLDNDNIIYLSFLAKKYKVPSLIEVTNDFFDKHHDELALQILLAKQNQPQFETSTYENIISAHFDEYIKSDDIFLLNISILYRIFHKYQINNEQKHSKSGDNEVINFLFKCLDKYGREASVLFDVIDFGHFGCMKRLLDEYSEIFDFNFVNSSVMKSLYETQSNIIQAQIKQENEINKMKQESLNKELERKRKDEENSSELKLMREEMNRMKQEFLQKESERKRKEEENLNKLKSMKEEMNKMKQESLNNESERKRKEEKNLNELKLMKDEMNKLKSSFQQNQIDSKKKEEESLNEIKSLKEEMSRLKQELVKKDDENSNKIKSIQKDLLKQIQEHKIKESPTKSINSNASQDKAIEEMKKSISRMQRLITFDHENCKKLFNEYDGQTQKRILCEMESMFSEELNFDNFIHIVNFLEHEVHQSESSNKPFNYIFIPKRINNEINNSIIGIKSDMTETLFKNNKLESDEFKKHINNFSEFHIEIKYPSANFDSIYEIIQKMKFSFGNKLKIIIFITGIKKTDQKFHDNKIIDGVVIDSCVTDIESIGDNGSFECCYSLSQVYIPPSVTNIGKFAFYVCKLTEITIPYSVTKICEGAFMSCRSLKKLVLPSSLNSIENRVFEECELLTQVLIPSSVTSINRRAFFRCSSLTQITIPSSVTSIGKNAFFECSSLTQITIPSSVDSDNIGISSKVKVIRI